MLKLGTWWTGLSSLVPTIYLARLHAWFLPERMQNESDFFVNNKKVKCIPKCILK